MNSFESAVINVEFFWKISTFNINNFTTEIKKSNTFVGFCYIKMKPKGGKKKEKKRRLGKQPTEEKVTSFSLRRKNLSLIFFFTRS